MINTGKAERLEIKAHEKELFNFYHNLYPDDKLKIGFASSQELTVIKIHATTPNSQNEGKCFTTNYKMYLLRRFQA